MPKHLETLSTDAARELDVLGHDGHALGMNRAEVGVLEERHKVRLRRLLQRHDGVRLEAEVRPHVLRHLAHEALERQLADQKLRGLLVLADHTQRHGSRTVAVRLLHTVGTSHLKRLGVPTRGRGRGIVG